MNKIFLYIAAFAASAATAQTLPENHETPSRDQRIERITHEDKASRIEELREGGQTRRITVQPKGEGMPAYEVEPAQRTHGAGAASGGSGTNGRSTWRAFEF